MVDAPAWWSLRRRAIAFATVAVALMALALIMGRHDPLGTLTVGELADSSPGHVNVVAVFVEPPVTFHSGTMFTIAESPDSKVRVDVYYPRTTLLETDWGSKVLSGDDLVGHELVVRGEYDGDLLLAHNIVIRSGGGYGQPTEDLSTH